jgi:hypothetical protein
MGCGRTAGMMQRPAKSGVRPRNLALPVRARPMRPDITTPRRQRGPARDNQMCVQGPDYKEPPREISSAQVGCAPHPPMRYKVGTPPLIFDTRRGWQLLKAGVAVDTVSRRKGKILCGGSNAEHPIASDKHVGRGGAERRLKPPSQSPDRTACRSSARRSRAPRACALRPPRSVCL